MSYPKTPFTGFPFEDDFEDRNFRSQLDDIAQRHPEFAQHLTFDHFPTTQGRRRRGSDERTQPPPENRRFERPFRSRFEDFGFPFRSFDERGFPDRNFTQRSFEDRDFDDRNFGDRNFQDRNFQEPTTFQENLDEPDFYRNDFPDKKDEGKEGEKDNNKEVKKNIQQSNTVDLGKNQEPVDDQRGQRSMSAPPENRPNQPRFVSSINIPVQGLQQTTAGGTAGEQMGGKSSTHEKPMERVIPIHVEGRDEPVLPKNPNFTTTNQQQQTPQPEKIFGRNPTHFTQFLNKGEPHANPDDFRQQQKNYQQKQRDNYQQHQNQNYPQNQNYQQQQNYPPNQNYQQQNQQSQNQQPQNQQQQSQETQEQKKPSSQLDQIQNIQKDVSELMNRVEKFNGKPKDKEYLYLDEMLTRNLIKLDNIETEGKDNIRQARKEAIKCIESCIGILEAKANANVQGNDQLNTSEQGDLTQQESNLQPDQSQQDNLQQDNLQQQDKDNLQKDNLQQDNLQQDQSQQNQSQQDETQNKLPQQDDTSQDNNSQQDNNTPQEDNQQNKLNQSQEVKEIKENLQKDTSKDNIKDEKNELIEDKKSSGENAQQEENKATLEVSGVARSGTLVEGQTPMEVAENKSESDGKPEEKKEKKKVTKKKEKVDKK